MKTFRFGFFIALAILITSNCERNKSITSEQVEIFLTELEEGCWCTCPFENDFRFRYTNGDRLHILFTAETSCYPDGPATVDTTIVLQ